MSRDRAVPVLLGLLLLLALPSAGFGGIGPATPGAFFALAVLLAGFFALVVGPALEGAGTGRPLALLVASLPFLAYGALETPAVAGTHPVPSLAFWAAVVVALVVPATGRHRAGWVVAGFLTLLAAGALLGEVPTSPLGWTGGSPERILAQRAPDAEFVGPKRGAPVAVDRTPLGRGPGPFLVAATRGRYPAGEPLYLVFGAGGSLVGRERGAGTFLPGSEVGELVSAVELDAYDATIVLPGAWDASDPSAVRLAAALAIRARRGGVLVGPAPGRAWPPALGRELGSAGRGWAVGLEGAQPFGLGLVARASSEAGIREVLASAAGRPRVGTVFDPSGAPAPPLPAGLAPWSDRPRERRPQGILLAVYVVVAVLLDLVLRGAVPRVMGLVAPALAVALGLVWTSPADPGVRVHALAFELGGGGGRRLEATALASGPAGWIGPCRYPGAGFLRLLGGHAGPDGLVRVRPGRTAWVLRETVAVGQAAPEPEARRAGFLRGLLRGEVDPTRLRFGRGGPLGVELGGLEPPVTWIVRWR